MAESPGAGDVCPPPQEPESLPLTDDHLDTVLDASQPPGQDWALPAVNPERAWLRRHRRGRFGLSILPPVLLAVGMPGVVAAVLALRVDPPAAAPTSLLLLDVDQALRALERAREEVKARGDTAVEATQVEARRAAVRGAALVEQELRRLGGDQTRAPVLAPAPTGVITPPRPQASLEQLEPFLGRVGLISPADAMAGEVVLDPNGRAVAGALPESFAPFVVAEPGNSQEAHGLTAYLAPVRNSGLRVLAVRALPPATPLAGLDALQQWLPQLEGLRQQMQPAFAQLEARQDFLHQHLRWVALWSLVATALAGFWCWRLVRRNVVDPVRRLRDQVERLRAGLKPGTPDPGDPLVDLHESLLHVAEGLAEKRTLMDALAERNAVLDGVLEACNRAQQGDLTVRPPVASGTEGMVAMAVSNLLDAVEERATRVRGQARALVREIEASHAAWAQSTVSPQTLQAAQLARVRAENLLPLAGLLRAVVQRLAVLANQAGASPAVAMDLRKLSQALTTRADAVAALLSELQTSLDTVVPALASPRPGADPLNRASQLAKDLSRDARTPRVDLAFPAVVGALRDQPVEELKQSLDGSM